MVGRWYTTRREVVPSRFFKGHPTLLQRCPIYSHPQLLAGCVRSGKLGSNLQHPLQCRRSSACSSTCGVGLCQMLCQSLKLPHRCVISAGLCAWTNPGGLAKVECCKIGTSWSHGCSGLMLQTCQGVLLCGSRWYARGAYMVHTSDLQVCNFLVRSQPPSWRSVIQTQISMLGESVWWLRNARICRPIWEPILHWVPLAGGRIPRLVLRLCLGLDLGVVWLHPPRWSPIALGVDNLGLPGPCRLMGHRYPGWTQSKTDCLIFLPWGAVCIQLSLFLQGCHSTSIFSLWLDDASRWPEFIRNQGIIGHGISYDNLCFCVEMLFISLELGSYACFLNVWFSNSCQRHLTSAPFDLKSPSR